MYNWPASQVEQSVMHLPLTTLSMGQVHAVSPDFHSSFRTSLSRGLAAEVMISASPGNGRRLRGTIT